MQTLSAVAVADFEGQGQQRSQEQDCGQPRVPHLQRRLLAGGTDVGLHAHCSQRLATAVCVLFAKTIRRISNSLNVVNRQALAADAMV